MVLWTANVAPSAITGNWQALTDSTAAGGEAMWNPDAGQAKISPALASPSNFFEMTFNATAGIRITCGSGCARRTTRCRTIRCHLQFSDSVDSGGTPTMRMGTTESAEVVLQDGPSGAADHGWGWSDNGWGVPGVNIYFATTGTHTIRIQQREDGADRRSNRPEPGTYLTTAPGPRRDDTTIISP